MRVESEGTTIGEVGTGVSDHAGKGKRKGKKYGNLWWRISDEKIKECKTADVLGMQREVYLLFYELEKDERDA